MSTLEIIINLMDDEDYYGNPESVKELTGKINGQPIAPVESFEHTVSDEECKLQYKAKLADLEYEWTKEL